MSSISQVDNNKTAINWRSIVLSRPFLITVLVVSLAMLGWAISSVLGDMRGSAPTLVYYDVKKSDLPIVVTERGYLESQEQTTISCQVESYSRGMDSNGTTILYIVPNGSVVEEGELLVELDSAAIRDRLETEKLEFQSDQSALVQAKARRENQVTQNETSIAEAELALKLAELDREMYDDKNSGTFKLAMEEIERQIDDTRNSILEAQAALKLQETEKAGIEELFKLGYKGKSDLDQSRFAFMKSEAALAAAVNRMNNHEASREQLEDYEYTKEMLRLNGAVETAKRNLKQVKVTNESELAQVDAQLFEAEERVARQKSRINHYERQLEYCTIKAPHSGMVVYAQGGGRYGNARVGEGAKVRERQELLKLPDLSQMQVRTQIHEAVLDQVDPGLPVTIRVDAFASREYRGVVKEVAVVPSSSAVTNSKTYDCVITIPDVVDRLKPGMTAVSEIHVARLEDIIAVPVQAIVQQDGATWCYVEGEYGTEKKFIELGQSNDQFVHVSEGLEVGQRVVLNPQALLELEQRSGRNEIAPDLNASEVPEIDSETADDQLESAQPKTPANRPTRRRGRTPSADAEALQTDS